MNAEHLQSIRSMNGEGLARFVSEAGTLLEREALAVLDNPHCSTPLCLRIALDQKLTAYTSVRCRLVTHRATPQAHALKLIRYLGWIDMVRISTDVRVHPSIRKSIENQLALKVGKLTLGEKISSGKTCSRDLIRLLMRDPDPRVFESILINPRLKEEDLVVLINGGEATVDQVSMTAAHYKWSSRYAIRMAIVLSEQSPRAVAASQLRFLKRLDLSGLLRNPKISIYLRRCIERILSPAARGEGSIPQPGPGNG